MAWHRDGPLRNMNPTQRLAGLAFRIYTEDFGVGASFSGFNDKLAR